MCLQGDVQHVCPYEPTVTECVLNLQDDAKVGAREVTPVHPKWVHPSHQPLWL